MSSATTFQQYLQSAFYPGTLSTDEAIEFILQLFEEVKSFHDNNLVASFDKPDTVFITNGRLDIDENFAHAPIIGTAALQQLLHYQRIHGYTVTERIMMDEDLTQGHSTSVNLQVQLNRNEALTHPVYFPGYTCYEMKAGHHDAQTDIFCLGLILGSMVMGLNLYDPEDLNRFAQYRNHPAALNNRMHPTICGLITEMTELDRAQRLSDLQEIIQRIRHYRDYNPERRADLSKLKALENGKAIDRKTFILSKLKNRLFDTSRRNRLLYYKPNTRFVNLTVSSVPMVLHYQSINPQLLFTWNEEISSLVIRQEDISLNKYLRFEDHPYLNAQLSSIRQLSEFDKKEFGFSQMKLVVAFLHWHNLKEDPKERIQSPLLLLPVELEKKKLLKEDRYTLKIIDNTAIINPVLANLLKETYGITLPESIDFDEISMQEFYELLREKIDAARQGVKLNLVDKPRIRIIHSIARQTINNYRKRLKQKGSPAFHQVDYSYSHENYKPLGLELFKQKIEPRLSSMEFLLGETRLPGIPNNFAENRTSFQLADGEQNPYSWDFDICNIVLGNFNYKKMSLVGDYNKVSDEKIEHPVFNQLFSNGPRNIEEEKIVNDPAEWFHVITADPTQAKAILYSRKGKSYIIQGPPGTGKSQTITNLIADFLAKGKTILFVCEKRAALDVVYHRLQQNKLSELCSYIHDSQSDKKEFIKDLKAVYAEFINHKLDLASIRSRRQDVLKELQEQIRILSFYHQQQQHTTPEAGISTRKLIEKVTELSAELRKSDTTVTAEVPDYHQWIKYGEDIRQLSQALQETGAEAALSKHPFSNLGIPLIRSENPVLLMESLVQHSHQSIRQISEIIAKNNIPPEHAAFLENIKNLIENSVAMETLAQTRNLQLVESGNPEAQQFEEAYKQYRLAQETFQQAQEKNRRWTNKFDKEEIEQSIPLARKHENSFFSFLNGNWRRLRKQLKQSYDFSSHNVKPAFSTILEQLQLEYREQENLSQAKNHIQQSFRISDIESTHADIEDLRRKQGDKEIDYLLQHPNANELVLKLSKLNNILQQLELQLGQCLSGYSDKPLRQISDEISTIHGNADVLKELLPGLRKFAAMPEPLQQAMRKLPLTPVQFEAAMARKTLQHLLKQNLPFANIDQAKIQDCANRIEQLYKALLQINSELICAERRQQFRELYDISNAPSNNLSEDQKQLKKEYAEGRKVLEHEMSKTMRYKSIRELASNESGRVLRDIKPVWLMSPLSVSDSLPLDPAYFDVVIFDEASQITLEEGIPALFRAPQTIIVGDDKQMPPTNFFNAKVEDPEDLETVDGESEDEILSADSDSLLVQGSRKLSNTMLSWHYRSRYETLISYSNHAFYDARLLTIPDNTIHHQSKPLLEVNNQEEGFSNAPKMLKGSFSFHYLPNSIYEARGNQGEARYIANMVKQLLMDNTRESIGIVAFSQEQQGVIEEAIDNLAALDKTFEEVLEKAYNRKDDGQFTGLFIKNLENVQGDERDIIIMSVCYGHDSNRNMYMNFGPINRKGGEKRLNVIFSRARKHMAVVSSIRYTHITNEHNDGANYFRRFLQYAEMVSTGNMSQARTILDSLIIGNTGQKASKITSSAIAHQLKAALESKGYYVDMRIGQSSFKCSLGVKKNAEDNAYCLGILVDEEDHYSNDDVVEQYYQRPSLLRSFGWSTMNVFAKDWLEESERILKSIERKLENETIAVAETVAQPALPETQAAIPGLIIMHSKQNDQFWQVVQSGNKLSIRFGKTDTKGQVQIQSFISEAEAKQKKDEMIAEKTKQGYIITE
ncbi:MAG: AAA domain-containing protein [Pseudobacter sp.]|uniref:AAA domain-containing protein n=1 Tax=Pseudobacter sp. TaxID=2045420 RepID=UPI003F80E8EA